MPKLVGAIPEGLHGLEEHGDPMAMPLPTTGVDEGACRRT
jgi:hypothetical protein